MNDLLDSLLGDIDSQVCFERLLVRIINAGEALDFPSSSLGICTFVVCLLAVFQRRSYVNEVEISTSSAAILDNVILSCFPALFERCDRCCDDCCSSSRQLSCNISDPLDVLMSIFLREAKLAGEFASHGLAEQERD